ncbi:alg3, alpha-1,3- mannosyltransferase isoform X1 [Dermacentor variabilis]|uniref:alg3, alpha-1,3- mannosyltransferase isoform X1 n=2 Tax=Dermacentor variabilis TaxID=34621 RepID=UPI003F5BF1EA
MAPPRSVGKRSQHHRKNFVLSRHLRATYNCIMNDLRNFSLCQFVNDPGIVYLVVPFLLIIEFIVNVTVISKVPYTEIDWKAYMQEVEGVLNGTYDYAHLKGDTGPLVYPAGFVYIFMALYYITGHGTNIPLAQYLYAGLYLFTLCLVFSLYNKTCKVPPYVLVLMCATSYRIHSIYVLRLFNDPVAMALLYASLSFLIRRRWVLGCILFSLAVSVKMNILLFAPALFFVLLSTQGLVKTCLLIFLCGLIQLVLALPFLLANPVSYMMGAFNLGRVFLYKWTVNWRFLPEELFVDHMFHLALLALHLVVILCFLPKWIRYLKLTEWTTNKGKVLVMFPDQILLPLFTCNFIGMAFSRSLHYQFYVWYYHTVPYLLWSTRLSGMTCLTLWGMLELAWNTFPSTSWSSGLLHLSHFVLLVSLWKDWPTEPSVPPSVSKNK